MIPVSLRLKNFLSYGTAAEELDFGSFSVACLSGANGQGKSALLDAITWAIWGEARKSSDRQKPDEELLRIGAREMEVELVFDLEGTRYRITRSFQRSASGKTSKPGLECHVLDPESGAYRPLTAESVRATQAVIDQRVGVDYDTFINSAFLLQGRSDEFTKKKPGDRKDVLGKILGLDRYERLAARAGQRYNEFREAVRRYEAEVERLQAALEAEGQWQAEREAAAETVAALGAERDRLRAEENALRERLAALDAVARQAETHRDALRRLAERRARLDEEAMALARKIEEAEALVARSEAIERDHARYEALIVERDRLDERAEMRRGIDGQLQAKKLELEKARMEQEKQVERLHAEIEADRSRLRDDEQRVRLELPLAREEAQRSEEAEAERAGLQARFEERQRLNARIAQLDKQLDGERNQVVGRRNALLQQIRAAEAAAVSLDALRVEATALAGAVEEIQGWTAEQDAVREEGTEAKSALLTAEAERQRLAAERAAVEERRARLRSTDEEACPTCGTPLTEAHRRTVDATYRRETERLDAAIAAQDAEIQRLTERRDALRQRFVVLRERIGSKNGAVADLARLQQRLELAETAEAALAQQRAELDRIGRRLDADAFLPEVRAERTALQDRLDAEPFDEAEYERVRREADRLPERKRRLSELEALAERRDALRRSLDQREAELRRRRADLDDGAAFRPIRDAIGRLEAQLQKVAYDGARHEAVRQEVAALREAPHLFIRLMEAQRNLTEWCARRQTLAEDGAALDREEAEHREALRAAEARLGDRAHLEAQHAERARERGEVETRCTEAQARLGALDERLQRCADDRAALKRTRADLREAKRQASLYRHLRGAFSKHGIPSLIIEETLPEIEERANALLDRLSNGRTHVALETLKDKKTGGTKETLDIRITDEQGVARSYETFSGGEAFRVNFALRIALAQLLAERSGVRIRSLVVDEGFGTQDKEGIQNLVEAIRTIQDDFDKILVITHLDELKDAFPIRIEVTKRPVDGSTFEIVGV